mgnify:CR=1 FL=1
MLLKLTSVIDTKRDIINASPRPIDRGESFKLDIKTNYRKRYCISRYKIERNVFTGKLFVLIFDIITVKLFAVKIKNKPQERSNQSYVKKTCLPDIKICFIERWPKSIKNDRYESQKKLYLKIIF